MSPKRDGLLDSLPRICSRSVLLPLLAAWLLTAPICRSAVALQPEGGRVNLVDNSDLIHPIRSAQERVNMTVNSSIILMMEKNVPRVQVGNPDLLTLTPLSARQVQVHAKATGITKVTLWDEENRVFTVEVSIYGDTRELTELLKAEFPGAAITVRPTAAGVVLGGTVDRADDVNRIITMAQDYYPKVINNIYVGGVPQVILHVKVMEVSRTKLRDAGIDLTDVFSQGNSFFSTQAAGITKMTQLPEVVYPGQLPITSVVSGLGAPTISMGILNQFSDGFYGFIQMLQRNNILKVLSEPTLVTTSGRPAYFLSGGEMPIPVPQSLGTISIQFRKFGTQVDFVPIVLGSGRIHLEVRPKISEIDPTVSITLNGSTIPGFRTRECDTGVEMNAGQTLALAGLLQTDVNQQVQGIPYLMDIPYIGLCFRRSTETVEETELLIMVRPELAEAMNCEQVPPVGPGVGTMSPDDCGFYFKGYNEVPAPPPPPPGGPGGIQPMGPGAGPMGPNGYGPMGPNGYGPVGPGSVLPPGAVPDSMEEVPSGPAKTRRPPPKAPLPPGTEAGGTPGQPVAGRPVPVRPDGTPARRVSTGPAGASPSPRPNRINRSQLQSPAVSEATNPVGEPPEFIGPTGYDVSN
ncbi:MAG TPA: pilus assembly protein N-terminal domain-containing protein [Pirellulales bacterium]|jgi:pilus assembly protein CpaC|nr:pilus assembly protein N-terminal domain-containing protein [Pirellulales bacterium]